MGDDSMTVLWRARAILMSGGDPRASWRLRSVAIAISAVLSATASAQDSASIAARAPNYASPALQRLVAEAVRANARLPEGLRGYAAEVETEMSVLLRDSSAHERTTQLEQIASEVRWRAPDRYAQRVVGYRSQTVGPTFSMLSVFGGWTTPVLYGNRLRLGVTPVSTRATRSRGARDLALAVHPLAEGRDAYYRFAGGDTVTTLQTRTRRIPIVRLLVEPRDAIAGSAVLFAGEVDLDADRKQVVRMRGRMIEVREGKQTISAGGRFPGASAASFVELVNVEVDGMYWLPAVQRTEFQANFALFGDLRTMVRLISRFRDHRVNDSVWTTPPDTAPPGRLRHSLVFAATDSLSRFDDWRTPIGTLSGDARATDFEDVAPESWRPTGAPRLRFRPRAIADLFRFNRVEGVFTGASAEYDFRDRVPGALVRANAGWAWAERTARGSLEGGLQRGRWTSGLRFERTLATTNDFRPPLATTATVAALLGSEDDFDYLDRWSASAAVQRALGAERRGLVRLEIGPASDRAVSPHVSRGIFESDSGFRAVRGIEPGDYLRSVATLEWNPQVSAFFLERGVGGRLRYERADGGLRWQRLEGRISARREVGPFRVLSRVEGGMLLGAAVPQAMFEIGRDEGLTSYEYKEFGGDRAAIARTMLSYDFPILRSPLMLPSRLILPGLSPGLSIGVQGGWAEASSESARRALLALGARTDSLTGALVPLSRPTDGIRASADLRLTFFSGAASIGIARAIDRADRWRFVWLIGQAF